MAYKARALSSILPPVQASQLGLLTSTSLQKPTMQFSFKFVFFVLAVLAMPSGGLMKPLAVVRDSPRYV